MQGWVLLAQGLVPETVVNTAFTTLGAGARVVLLDGTYTLAALGMTFTANQQTLEGQGRSTFIDGDALPTGVHAINLSGFDDCTIRNLSVQTEDGGDKLCHCIFIEDGADRFHLENLVIVDSDSDGIHIEGTTISGGGIVQCTFLNGDEHGLHSGMDGGNYLDHLHVECNTIHSGDMAVFNNLDLLSLRYGEVTGNVCYASAGDGIYVFECLEVVVTGNLCYGNGGYGIYLNTDSYCICSNNIHISNVADGINLWTSMYCTVTGNVCYNSGDNGIWLGLDSTNNTVSGNALLGDETDVGIYLTEASNNNVVANNVIQDFEEGIWLVNAPSQNVIEGNICLSCNVLGIVLDTNANETIIANNFVQGTVSDGISIADCYRIVVEGNVLDSNGWNGIWIGSSGSHFTITGNFCYNNVRNGISGNLDYISIVGNYCYLNDRNNTGVYNGISLWSEGGLIEGNTCIDNHGNGILADYAKSVSGNVCLGNDLHGIRINEVEVLINGNSCYDNSQDAAGTYHGIYLSGDADRCLILGNYCNAPGDSQEDGIHLADGATNCLISSNYCYNGMGSGIALMANNDDCSIVENYCMNNDDYGIEILTATCDRTRVKDNKLIGNVTGQILDNGTDTQLPYRFVEVKDPDGTIGTHPCIILTDGIDTTVRFQLYCPLEMQQLVHLDVIVVQIGTAGSPNMQWSTVTNWGKLCADESYLQHNDAETDQITAITQNHLECVNVFASVTGIAGGDLVGFAFTRRGSQAGDTVNADIYWLGCRARYV